MISIPMNPEPRAVFLKYLMEDPLSLAGLSEELSFFPTESTSVEEYRVGSVKHQNSQLYHSTVSGPQ